MARSPTLFQQFRALRPGAATTRDEQAAERALATLIDAGRTTWPQLSVSDARMLELLAAKLSEPGEDWLEGVAALDGAELYVACGCADGDNAAISAFEAMYFQSTGPILRRMNLDGDGVAEIQQLLRQRLFVRAEGEPWPRVCQYAGRGELGALVRTAAVRAAVDQLRRNKREVDPDDALFDLPAISATPELAYLHERGRRDLKQSFEDAIRTLSTRDLNLLRLHLVDGLSVDEISRLYRVHRVTVSRWLSDARTRIAEHTRKLLAEDWGLGGSDLDRALDSVRSQLDLSLSRLLGDPVAQPG
ncbi:MAG: sigma factor-like helix-turn-helix DNA-binding protein [Kofleriaceae bacterium]